MTRGNSLSLIWLYGVRNLQVFTFAAGRDTAYDPAYSTRRAPPVNYGIRIVPERTAFIVERFGKYNRTLQSGIHLLIPLVLNIPILHSTAYELELGSLVYSKAARPRLLGLCIDILSCRWTK